MCSNIPTSHLEQLILLSTQGILTLHKDNLTLMKDANLLDSFKAFGIDLAKLQLSTGALEGQVGTAHIEGQVIQGSSTSNVHGIYKQTFMLKYRLLRFDEIRRMNVIRMNESAKFLSIWVD